MLKISTLFNFRLLATDPESMSIKARPTQRLQLLALNVIVDQVLNRSEMGFESDIAKAIADLVDKARSEKLLPEN